MKSFLFLVCFLCLAPSAQALACKHKCPAPPSCPVVDTPDLSVVVAACQSAAASAASCDQAVTLGCSDLVCPEAPACPECPDLTCPEAPACPTAPACPEVKVETTLLACKKVRTLKNGTVRGTRCRLLVEQVKP